MHEDLYFFEITNSSHKFEHNQNKKADNKNNQFSKMPAKANKKKPGLIPTTPADTSITITGSELLKSSPCSVVTPTKKKAKEILATQFEQRESSVVRSLKNKYCLQRL